MCVCVTCGLISNILYNLYQELIYFRSRSLYIVNTHVAQSRIDAMLELCFVECIYSIKRFGCCTFSPAK